MTFYYVGGARGVGKSRVVSEVNQRLKKENDVEIVEVSKELSKLARDMLCKRIEDINEYEREELRSNLIDTIIKIDNRIVILDSHYVCDRNGTFELLVPKKIKDIINVWCLVESNEGNIIRNRINDYSYKKRDLSAYKIKAEIKEERKAAVDLAKSLSKELFIIKNDNLPEAVDQFTNIIEKGIGKLIFSNIEFIRAVDKNEVYAAFLSYEYEERLPKDRLNGCRTLLSDKNSSLDTVNNYRIYELLKSIRGQMIIDLPDNVSWYLIKTDLGTFAKFNAINYPTWNILSRNTHVFQVAAKNILNTNTDIDNLLKDEITCSKNKINDIINKNDGYLGFRPIVITTDVETIPTIIEGHHRAVALLSTSRTLNKPIEMFLGISKDFKYYSWICNK